MVVKVLTRDFSHRWHAINRNCFCICLQMCGCIFKASLRIWTDGFPIKAIVFVWNPRTGEDGQLTTTGPSVRGGVRNPVVDGGPWKLVPNSPLARFPPCLLRQATSACCRCLEKKVAQYQGCLVTCETGRWAHLAPTSSHSFTGCAPEWRPT